MLMSLCLFVPGLQHITAQFCQSSDPARALAEREGHEVCWSKGKLQVFIDPPMMPSNFVGETITGLRLRRTAFEGSGAYPAMTRTMQIHGGFQPFPAVQMIGSVRTFDSLPPTYSSTVSPLPVPGADPPFGGRATYQGGYCHLAMPFGLR